MTTIHDLRSYLEVLEAAGQLARVRQPVSLDHELADVAAALERQGGPAPLFENVDTSARGGEVRRVAGLLVRSRKPGTSCTGAGLRQGARWWK